MISKLQSLKNAFNPQQYSAVKNKADQGSGVSAGLTALGLLMSARRAKGISRLGLIISGGALLHQTLSAHSEGYNRWTRNLFNRSK